MRASLVVVGCIAGFAMFVGGVNDAATQQNITTGPVSPLLVAGPLSERIVAYEIDAHLDPEAKTIEATQTLTYHNRTGRPLREFPFHLYLNGFRRGSTMLKEIGRGGSGFTRRDNQYGEIEVTSLEVEGMGDLTGAMEFVQPDDDNTEDHTVFQVRLPEPDAPEKPGGFSAPGGGEGRVPE